MIGSSLESLDVGTRGDNVGDLGIGQTVATGGVHKSLQVGTWGMLFNIGAMETANELT